MTYIDIYKSRIYKPRIYHIPVLHFSRFLQKHSVPWREKVDFWKSALIDRHHCNKKYHMLEKQPTETWVDIYLNLARYRHQNARVYSIHCMHTVVSFRQVFGEIIFQNKLSRTYEINVKNNKKYRIFWRNFYCLRNI